MGCSFICPVAEFLDVLDNFVSNGDFYGDGLQLDDNKNAARTQYLHSTMRCHCLEQCKRYGAISNPQRRDVCGTTPFDGLGHEGRAGALIS